MLETPLIAILGALAVLVLLMLAALWRLAGLARMREDEMRTAVREGAELRGRLDALTAQTANVERDIRQDLASARAEQAQAATSLRVEVGGALGSFREATQQQLTAMAGLQQRQLQGFGEQLGALTATSEQRLEAVRLTVEQRLDALRAENTAKLEQMRSTVDEKLQATLDQRLSAIVQDGVRAPRAGASGLGRDAVARHRRRRPETRSRQREDPRHVGRGAACGTAGGGADATTVCAQRRNRAGKQSPRRVRHPPAGTRR